MEKMMQTSINSENDELKIKIDDYERQIFLTNQKIENLKKNLLLFDETDEKYKSIQEQIALLSSEQKSLIVNKDRLLMILSRNNSAEDELQLLYGPKWSLKK